MNSSFACLLFTIIIFIQETTSLYIFKTSSFSDGKFLPYYKDKHVNHEVAEDGFMTSKLALTVADGVGQSFIPAGYFAYGLCYQTMLTYFSNQGARSVNLSKNNPTFWTTLNNGLDVFMKSYALKSTTFNTHATHPHSNSLDPENIISHSTLVTVYLDNKPKTNQVFLKHFQKGDSQFMIFRLLENDNGTFNYVPIYLSHDQQFDFNSSPQFSSDTYKEKRSYYDENEIVDEIEVLESDIVLLGSDGLFDNLFLSYITYLVNMIVKDMYYHHIFNEDKKMKPKYDPSDVVNQSLKAYIQLLNEHWNPFHVMVEEIKKQQVQRRSVNADRVRVRTLSKIEERSTEENDEDDDELSHKEEAELLQSAIDKMGQNALEKIIEVEPIEEKPESETSQSPINDFNSLMGSQNTKIESKASIDQSDYESKDIQFKVKKIIINKVKMNIPKMFAGCKVMEIINDPTVNEESDDVISLCARKHIEEYLSFGTEEIYSISKFFNGGTLARAIANAATSFYKNLDKKLHPFYVKAWEYQEQENYGHPHGKPDDVTVVASIVYKVNNVNLISTQYTDKLKSHISFETTRFYRQLEKDIIYLRKNSSTRRRII